MDITIRPVGSAVRHTAHTETQGGQYWRGALTVIGYPVRPVSTALLHHGVVYTWWHARRALISKLLTWLHPSIVGLPLYSAIAFASFKGSRKSTPEAFRVTLFMKWYVGQFAVVPLPDLSVPSVHCSDTVVAAAAGPAAAAAAREAGSRSSNRGAVRFLMLQCRWGATLQARALEASTARAARPS